MEHDWKKATLIPAVAAKNRDAANLTRHLHGGGGGHLLSKAIRHPSLTKLVIIFIWFDKGHVVTGINSLTFIWISNVANLRNFYLTEKQHSRHQQFWRFPWSPLEVSSRIPRSCDHLFSHSMSKASPLQEPDMWYLTFYENKVPIYQSQSPTPFNSNSHTSHFCTKMWSKTLVAICHGRLCVGLPCHSKMFFNMPVQAPTRDHYNHSHSRTHSVFSDIPI